MKTPEFQGTHLWERLHWAKENLEPVQSDYRVVYENDEIGVTHAVVKFKSDGNIQGVMSFFRFKDGKLFRHETGASNLPKE